MNLDNVTVELRPRTEWEAADLGARMVRRDARTIYAAWFAITLPLYVLACLAIWFSPFPGYVSVAYWWLEPITDGVILHIISRRLFGEQVGFGATMRETLRLAWRNVIFLLPPYRFHFARSIAVPVTQLEGLRGSRRRTRAAVLNSRIMNFGTGVTVAYQHLFLALYFGVLLIVYALVPPAYQDTIGGAWIESAFIDTERTTYIAQLTFLYVAQSALHPWFVGAGFGLYINCRTQLEAWDIEVSFRRMVNRRAGSTPVAALIATLVIGIPLAMAPDLAFAQESEDEYADVDTGFSGYWQDEDIAEALETVSESDALNTWEEQLVWQKKDASDPTDVDEPDFDFGFFESIGKFLSVIVELWLWLVVAGLALLLYMTRDLWMPYLEDFRKPQTKPRRVILSSGEITADVLPTDIPAEVRRMWHEGKKRDALSLLFRGSVFYIVTEHGVRVPPSATEGACVDAVKLHGGRELSSYFEKVVMAWVLFAYGSREPADEVLQNLCADWPKHYGDAR
jgi:hypothetical protein